MIDEQSPASGHDYASNRWAIGAGVSISIISLGVDGGVWSIILSVLFSIFVSVPLRSLLVSMFLLRAVVWVWCMFLLVSIWFSFLLG